MIFQNEKEFLSKNNNLKLFWLKENNDKEIKNKQNKININK